MTATVVVTCSMIAGMTDLHDRRLGEHSNALPSSTTYRCGRLVAGRRGTVETDVVVESFGTRDWPPFDADVCHRVPNLHDGPDESQVFCDRLRDRDFLTATDPQEVTW